MKEQTSDTCGISHTSLGPNTSLGPTPNISVRATDTDVPLLLLYHVMDMTAKVWMDTHKYMHIKSLAAKPGPDVCQAHLAYHAFTGCHFTAAFFGKGKSQPYKRMLKHPETCDALGMLRGVENSPVKVHENIESFVCAMYDNPKLADINKVREAIFN